MREVLNPVPAIAVAGARSFGQSLVRFGINPAPDIPDSRIVVIETGIVGDPVTLRITADKVF